MLILTVIFFILMVFVNVRLRKLLAVIYGVILGFFILFGYYGLFLIAGMVFMSAAILIMSAAIVKFLNDAE